MLPWVQMAITAIVSILASSGFWAYWQKRGDSNDAKTQLLIGLAHDRIMYLGTQYIRRGWLTRDEYENLCDYLYKPYEELGGNGSAKRVMEEVAKLPSRPPEGWEEKKECCDCHSTSNTPKGF